MDAYIEELKSIEKAVAKFGGREKFWRSLADL